MCCARWEWESGYIYSDDPLDIVLVGVGVCKTLAVYQRAESGVFQGDAKAMNAGKSTTLLQSCYNYHERGMRTIVFIPKIIHTGKVIRRDEDGEPSSLLPGSRGRRQPTGW